MRSLLCRWRCWRRGVPKSYRGTSLGGIPACQWYGWNHTVEHVP